MSIPGLIVQARAAHLQLLTDTCDIARAEPGAVFDENTGGYTTEWVPMYSGPCRVKGPGAGSASVDSPIAGEAPQVVSRQTLVLPHGAVPGLAEDDRVQITSGPLLGVTFVVVGAVDSTTMSARSVLIEAVDDPADPAYDATGGTPAESGTLILDGGAP